MFYMILILLILMILSGILGIVTALIFPSKSARTVSKKIEQKRFIRGYMTIIICGIILGLFLSEELEAMEASVATVVFLLIIEYMVHRTAKHS